MCAAAAPVATAAPLVPSQPNPQPPTAQKVALAILPSVVSTPHYPRVSKITEKKAVPWAVAGVPQIIFPHLLFDNLQELIVTGAHGTIYAADRIEKGLSAPVIIKTNKYQTGYSYFIDEATHYERLRKLEIPHTIDLLDHFDLTSAATVQHALVFPRFHITLGKLLEDHEIKFDGICTIAKQILETLAALAQINECHGDLSFNNILIDPQTLQLRIIDLNPYMVMPIKLDKILTTLLFRAPEVVAGYPELDISLDMWAVGCILYHLATGESFPVCHPDQYNADMHLASIATLIGLPKQSFLQKTPGKSLAVFKVDQTGVRIDFKGPLPKINWKAKVETALTQKGTKKAEIDSLINLMEQMLRWEDRITAEQALKHPIFKPSAAAK